MPGVTISLEQLCLRHPLAQSALCTRVCEWHPNCSSMGAFICEFFASCYGRNGQRRARGRLPRTELCRLAATMFGRQGRAGIAGWVSLHASNGMGRT